MYQTIIEQQAYATARSGIGGDVFAPRDTRQCLRRLSYDPYAAGNGRQMVPRTFIERLPRDMADIASLAERQKTFITLMLPIVLRANEIMSLQRSMIRAESDPLMLEQAMRQYDACDLEQLDRRFDVVPPSLLLAIAAAATDWGRERTAHDLMALAPDSLASPANLPPSAVQALGGARRSHYRDLLSPMLDVIHGINTYRDGAALRRERSRQRRSRRFDGYRLALLLDGGHLKRSPFVRRVLYAMEGGALTRLDHAKLEAPVAVVH